MTALGTFRYRAANCIRACLLALTAIAIACTSQGASSTPSPNGQALALHVAATRGNGCQTAALLPVKVVLSGNSVVFVSVGTEQEVDLEWPPGFRAELVDGSAVIEDSSGAVFAHEGDVLSDLSGGLNAQGSYSVCASGSRQL